MNISIVVFYLLFLLTHILTFQKMVKNNSKTYRLLFFIRIAVVTIYVGYQILFNKVLFDFSILIVLFLIDMTISSNVNTIPIEKLLKNWEYIKIKHKKIK